MNIPRTTTSRKYPSFIRKNETLKKYSKQRKVFPKLGLDNCQVSIGDGCKLVFSGSGNKGLWDIATMSMRGIDSCQRWSSPYYACRLVGSMIDPYAGIIYITDGRENTRGDRMIRRAVVRFVVNRKTRKPALLLERIYWDDYTYRFDETYTHTKTTRLFKNFLKEKTGNKLPIISSRKKHFIPLAKSVSSIKASLWSYRDSRIGYKASKKYSSVAKISI